MTMLTNEEQIRYSRQIMLPEIGVVGQKKLKAAKVLIIGAGGLGCPVLQYLAAAGVGTIGIVDGDTVDLSNLQRQILYTSEHIDQQKVSIAKAQIQWVNPDLTINAYPVFINAGNAMDLFSKYDVIVDCTDNFAARYLINDACIITGKPLVFGSIYRFEGQVSVFNYKNGPTYRCIFPEAPDENEMPNCSDIGVIATLPGIIGTLQANEVLKVILERADVLSGILLTVNALTMDFQKFNFNLNPDNRNVHSLAMKLEVCRNAVKTISYERLREVSTGIQLVDVREPEERAIFHIGGLHIPLSQLSEQIHMLDPEKNTVVYCAMGFRSSKAAALLLDKGFKTVHSLENGIEHLISTENELHSSEF